MFHTTHNEATDIATRVSPLGFLDDLVDDAERLLTAMCGTLCQREPVCHRCLVDAKVAQRACPCRRLHGFDVCLPLTLHPPSAIAAHANRGTHQCCRRIVRRCDALTRWASRTKSWRWWGAWTAYATTAMVIDMGAMIHQSVSITYVRRLF